MGKQFVRASIGEKSNLVMRKKKRGTPKQTFLGGARLLLSLRRTNGPLVRGGRHLDDLRRQRALPPHPLHRAADPPVRVGRHLDDIRRRRALPLRPLRRTAGPLARGGAHLDELRRRRAIPLRRAPPEREEHGAGDRAEIQRVVGAVPRRQTEAGNGGHGPMGRGGGSSHLGEEEVEAEEGGFGVEAVEAEQRSETSRRRRGECGHPNFELGGIGDVVLLARSVWSPAESRKILREFLLLPALSLLVLLLLLSDGKRAR
jgi:hypothetical protein